MYWCFFGLGSDKKSKVLVEGWGPLFHLESLFVLNCRPWGRWGVPETCVVARSSYGKLL